MIGDDDLRDCFAMFAMMGLFMKGIGLNEESAKQSLAFAAAYDKESPQTPLFQLAIARKENNNSDAELYKRKYEEACLLKGTMHLKEHVFGAEAFVRKFGKNLF